MPVEVIDSVEDRVVIVCNSRPALLGLESLNYRRQVEVVIVIDPDWWTVPHGSGPPDLEVPCASHPDGPMLWPYLDEDCEDCQNAYLAIWYLAERVTDWCLNLGASQPLTITFVDLELSIQDILGESPHEAARQWFIERVKEHAAEYGEELDPAKHIRFMTRDEYRNHVGDEQFKLHMEVGY